MQKLSTRGPVATKSGYFRKLEVDEAKFQRKITMTVDGKDATFFLGSSPSMKKVHLRKSDDDNVHVVSGLSAWDIATDTKGWVDTKYVDVQKNDVWALHVEKTGGQKIQLERGAGDTWAVVGADKPPKQTEIDNLIRKASSMNFERPIGKDVKPEYGLTPPEVAITLVTGTSTIAGVPPKETSTRKISIGKQVTIDDVKQYYVKSDQADYVVTVPAWAIDPLLEKKPSDLVEN